MLRLCGMLCLAASLASCGIKTAGSPFLPQGQMQSNVQANGQLVLRVTLPPHTRRRPDYISASTKGMSVQISGPTTIKKDVGLTLGSSGCQSSLMTIQCTLGVSLSSCPSKKNCYTATVVTYDAFDTKTGTIPANARKLSAEISLAFWIGTGSTTVPLVLEGIPASVAFIPSAGSSLSGNQKSGFVEPKCSATSQTVNVLGVDADGSYIVGAGAPVSSLVSDDSAQLGVAKTSSPTIFSLAPPKAPAYPFGGHTIHLTVKVVPGSKSGGSAKNAAVDVSYSGDICGKLTEFPMPARSSNPFGIVAGPDGALWAAEVGTSKIARVTTTGKITQFPLPKASSAPAGIIVGPDHNLWFAEFTGNKIGRITTAGKVTEFGGLTTKAAPEFLAVGSDGNIWFAENGASQIGVMSRSGGLLHEYATLTPTSGLRGIVAAPDGALWFAECSVAKIGRITTSGTLLEYTTPTSSSGPFGITVGPDRSLWFAEGIGNIAQISTAGVVAPEYAVPTVNSKPVQVVTGPDGAIWFTEEEGGKIGRVTLGGAFTEFTVPTGSSNPAGITVGPDGAIWFTEIIGNKIGRLR